MNATNRLTPAKLLITIFTWISMVHLFTVGETSAQPLNTDKIPYQDISSGSLYFKSVEGYNPALTQNSDYQVSVNGLLARVNFTQTFKNSSDDFLEAIYVFPLIDDAAVDSMEMEIGERRIIGKIKEKHQAKKLYKIAKQQGKKTSLVTEQRPNLFTTKLANIAPGETIKISLSYLQSIALNNETFSFRIPLTLTPRYIPSPHSRDIKTRNKDKEYSNVNKVVNTSKIDSHGWALNNARVADASEITPFQTRLDAYNKYDSVARQQTVTLSVKLNTILPVTDVTSRYHQVKKKQVNDTLTISLANEKEMLKEKRLKRHFFNNRVVRKTLKTIIMVC